MNSFAIYRLPHATRCTLVEQTAGEPETFLSCTGLDGRRGFVVAPFCAEPCRPIVLINPDKVTEMPVEIGSLTDADMLPAVVRRQEYSADFERFHSQLVQGRFRKIVLARCATEQTSAHIPPIELFQRACKLYPRLYIALVNTPQSGMWLIASPEILLENAGGHWLTIALAGTMQLDENELNGEGEQIHWSTKNIQEQRYVASYVGECLKQFNIDYTENGPRTVRVANLVHLRSDFAFDMDPSAMGGLLDRLHPTPAVCGLPKAETFDFILNNEHTPRLYYSGFTGPLGIGGETHLYVSLRCMKIVDNQYNLYAGGGLLTESNEATEWQETEAKLETMRKCIATKQM